ncbi:quinone oxidoreductase family protein [Aurantimonas endophytica]|uniref:NADPH2:quinone reductase n=1 Tax=Aurantimonas endophytica TaxID=1522175 RepID=A0A7W6HAC2_9HYPH|nr:quinone oxidoreductase [Aurantimonas endophytica]MBB4001559.1 NADPH2:quinone reductase [Aurantimonas endophytica]MCO6402801.1 NADPH:quinone reductase [Aurantimonas endophytica]
MSKAIFVHETGGPDVLKWEDHDPGRPGRGEILVEQTAAGINFIDVYFRTGVYPSAKMPFVLGKEGVGIVAEVGEGVARFQPGDRVAYISANGSYAERIVIAADLAVAVPETIDDATAASIMLKGMTAEYLLNRTYKVGPETVLLFHAAAGGVGLIAGQWAKHLGATVIGTAGSQEKCELALANGYDHVINYRTDDFVARVAEITDGRKCDVVYDAVGKDTFPGSLDCLRKRGLWASFGHASGKAPAFEISLLNQKGSLFATRPSIYSYNSTTEELDASAKAVFDIVGSGAVRITVGQTYPLSEAAEAHRDLDARRTVGASVLTV